MSHDARGDRFPAAIPSISNVSDALSKLGTLPELWMVASVCVVFAAVSSWILLGTLLAVDLPEESGFYGRLLTKALVFTALGVVCALRLRRSARLFSADESTVLSHPPRIRRPMLLLFVVLAMVAALVFPNLDVFPWTGPDELHHLIVSRNLAEHAVYASGHTDSEFRYFDAYDSVGAPLIAPAAGLFRIYGTDYVVARVLMGCSYLVLCVLIFICFRSSFGDLAALFAVVMTTLSFGSIYLARAYYGEVPAMMFFMGGLLLWRHSIQGPDRRAIAFFAGACFGLAVLTKSFMLLAAFAFAIVFIYDRLTYRRIALQGVLITASGLLVTLAAWYAIEYRYRHLIAEDASVIVHYRHYLMFGLYSVGTAARWFLERPALTLIGAIAFTWVAPRIARHRYDPAMLVLLLMAVLFLFWWVFYTPARIPRYLWYTCAIGGMFSGVVLSEALSRAMRKPASTMHRVAAAALAGFVVAGGLWQAAPDIARVYAHNQMTDELGLAEFLRDSPPETTIATTYWGAARAMNFLADRSIPVFDDPREALREFDLVIMDSLTQTIPPELLSEEEHIGRYVILRGGQG
ncbi:MAG: glycosyltransferase family 39 protein [Candidatus Hydrogenedentes bacterium]|nr:glycosyltransferase family 39 protein [Candidatus Hydrogenedentota bacterium]